MRKILVLILLLAFQTNMFSATESGVRKTNTITQSLRLRRVQSNHMKHRKTPKRRCRSTRRVSFAWKGEFGDCV